MAFCWASSKELGGRVVAVAVLALVPEARVDTPVEAGAVVIFVGVKTPGSAGQLKGLVPANALYLVSPRSR